MPHPRVGTGRALLGGGGAVAAHKRILAAVTALDADASVYDPDNPDTWTLRESGGTLFYANVADGMGNRENLTQGSESAQPLRKTLSTGRRVWDSPADGKTMLGDFVSAIAQPNTFLFVGRTASTTSLTAMVDSVSATGGRQLLQGTNGGWRQRAGTTVDRTGGRTTGWQIHQGNFDGDSQHYIDGVQLGADADVGAAALGGIGILATGGQSSIASLGLVVAFSGLQSNAATAKLRSIINDTYPIGVSE